MLKTYNNSTVWAGEVIPWNLLSRTATHTHIK